MPPEENAPLETVVIPAETATESVSAPTEAVQPVETVAATSEPSAPQTLTIDHEAIGREWAEKNGYAPVQVAQPAPTTTAQPAYQPPAPAPYVSPFDRAKQEAQHLIEQGQFVDTEWVYKRAMDYQAYESNQKLEAITARLEAPIMAQELTSKGFNVGSDTMAQAYQIARSLTSNPAEQKTFAQSLALGYDLLTKGQAPAAQPVAPAKPAPRMPQAEGGSPAASGTTLTLTNEQRLIANSLAKNFWGQPVASPEVVAKLKKEGFLD